VSRRLTLKCEQRVEDAAEDIREWANDVVEGMYSGDVNRHSPGWWADKLPELVAEFVAAAEAYEVAPMSGPNAELAER
jgi:hypothetical protein